MSESKAAKKTAAKKTEAPEQDAPEQASGKPDTLTHPVDRSILKSVTTADLNPAYEVETD